MTPREHEEMLAAHFDDALDGAGQARLDQVLAGDASAARRFAGLAAVEGLLRARAVVPDVRASLVDAVMRSVPAGRARNEFTQRVMAELPARPRRRMVALAVAAAAVLLLALGIWSALRPRYPEPRAKGDFLVAAGGAVRRGSVVKTTHGTAVVTLGGYCRVDMRPESVLKVEGDKRVEQVFLEQGEISCEVDRTGAGFAVRTEAGTVAVTGTKFIVRLTDETDSGVQERRMRVRVLTGMVTLSGVWGNLPLQAGEEGIASAPAKVKGRVVLACPRGMLLKLKTEGGQDITFDVLPVARGQVKVLRPGEQVEVVCVRCPRMDRLVVLSVERPTRSGPGRT